MPKGSCVCGAVSYEISGPLMAFQYCFCSRCRKGSGSAHASNAFVGADQLRWLTGEDKVRRFDLPDARWWSRGWCDDCGGSTPWLTRSGKGWVVPAGTLDEPLGEHPRRGLYWGSRAEWYQHASEIELFEEFPKG